MGFRTAHGQRHLLAFPHLAFHVFIVAASKWTRANVTFVSLCFHIFQHILLFVVLRPMTKAVGAAAIVAALFAWHPLQVDSSHGLRNKSVQHFLGLLAVLLHMAQL